MVLGNTCYFSMIDIFSFVLIKAKVLCLHKEYYKHLHLQCNYYLLNKLFVEPSVGLSKGRPLLPLRTHMIKISFFQVKGKGF